jgi:hypothetical protein
MPDLWFLAGLALGICVTGFCAIGSFERGVDSVRRGVWSRELAARRQVVAARASQPDATSSRERLAAG